MKKPLLLSAIILLIFNCGYASKINYHFQSNGRSVYIGLENFIREHAKNYKGKKAALATNHSGFDFNLRQNIQLLRDQGIEISIVLAPEHGIHGYSDDVDYQYYRHDPVYKVQVYNLYKVNRAALQGLLQQVDIVIFDIQDMGMRCYTYITNLKDIIDALDGLPTRLIVLDRPNPVGFLDIDGAYLETKFSSHFVSAFPAPLLYGMTIGESARYYQGEFKPQVKLTLIKMSGYSRSMFFYETGLPWIPPSPNLPTYESAIVYTAVVLMEGINLSLGRGTAKPFEYIGAPWIEPVAFARILNDLQLKNFKFKPVYFKPLYSRYAGMLCGGVQIFYTGGNFSPMETAYKIIYLIMKNYPYAQWIRYGANFEIDALAGTDKFRQAIQFDRTYREFHQEIQVKLRSYKQIREKYLVYK